MKKLGAHYIIELVGCNTATLERIASVEHILITGAKKSGATIIKSHFHQFAPQGVSGVILIAESHFTIHTWPEDGYAAVDFFSCGEKMVPEEAVRVFKEQFEATEVSTKIIERGY